MKRAPPTTLAMIVPIVSSLIVAKVDNGKGNFFGSVARSLKSAVEGCHWIVGWRVVVVGGSNGKSKDRQDTEGKECQCRLIQQQVEDSTVNENIYS